jgi:3-oxoacyl-(acyl-carrier-protein) synthase
MRRIVVTGMGAVTPLAADVETSWSRLLAGRSGIRRLPDDLVGDLPAKVGGVVPSTEEDPNAAGPLAAPEKTHTVCRWTWADRPCEVHEARAPLPACRRTLPHF